MAACGQQRSRAASSSEAGAIAQTVLRPPPSLASLPSGPCDGTPTPAGHHISPPREIDDDVRERVTVDDDALPRDVDEEL
jgi:hypothetical protein